jgi:hypothetical protein
MVGGILTAFIMGLTLFPAIFYVVKKKEVLNLIKNNKNMELDNERD